MAIENIKKKVIVFHSKVKAVSNIATLLFLTAMTYSLYQWHRVSGFESFTDLLITAMTLVINIKFYRIYIVLRNTAELTEESKLQSIYRRQKQEYKEWFYISSAMLIILILLRLILG